MKVILRLFLLSYFLIPGLALAQAKISSPDKLLIDNISFEEEKGNIKVILTLNRPDKVFCYDVKNPPQVIIDILGDAYTKTPEEVLINKGSIKRILAPRDITKANLAPEKGYYPIDFFIVEVSQMKEYQLTSGNKTAVVEIGDLKAKEETKEEAKEEQPYKQEEERAVSPEAKNIKQVARIDPENMNQQPQMQQPMQEMQPAGIPKGEMKTAIEEEPEVMLDEEKQIKKDKKQRKSKRDKLADLKRKRSIDVRNKGYNAQMAGDIDKAVSYYQQAIRVDPKYPTPHNDLGIIYEEKGDLEKAAQEYKKAIELDSDYAGAYSNLALLYEKQGKLSQSLPYWQKRVALGESNDPWRKRAEEKLKSYK